MEEKVSIIIPVYQAESTIARCVSSICEGTYSNIEVLLVDDCSQDNSYIECQRLQEKYSQVKVLKNERNMGVSQTRNYALAQVSGKYLMFVDSDDWVTPNYVERFIQTHKKYEADLTVCGYVNHDEVQNNTTDYFGWHDVNITALRPLRQSLPDLLNGRLLQQIWNKLFLVSIIKEHEITFDPSIKMGEDFRFLLSYLACVKGDKLALINEYLYHYIRCSGTSAMSNFGKEKIDEPLKNMRMMYQVMGKSSKEIEKLLEKDKESIIKSYAYLIMHNMGMKQKDKKKYIYALSKENGKTLYKENRLLYIKERIAIVLNKMGLRK